MYSRTLKAFLLVSTALALTIRSKSANSGALSSPSLLSSTLANICATSPKSIYWFWRRQPHDLLPLCTISSFSHFLCIEHMLHLFVYSCLSIYLSVCLSVYLSLGPSVCVCLSFHLSVTQSDWLLAPAPIPSCSKAIACASSTEMWPSPLVSAIWTRINKSIYWLLLIYHTFIICLASRMVIPRILRRNLLNCNASISIVVSGTTSFQTRSTSRDPAQVGGKGRIGWCYSASLFTLTNAMFFEDVCLRFLQWQHLVFVSINALKLGYWSTFVSILSLCGCDSAHDAACQSMRSAKGSTVAPHCAAYLARIHAVRQPFSWSHRLWSRDACVIAAARNSTRNLPIFSRCDVDKVKGWQNLHMKLINNQWKYRELIVHVAWSWFFEHSPSH